ncbi:MAG: hypothetical protein FJX74_24850, partial [Armatimonadetes bacterium]|nr:hypothetical protein [Armatimonadota bacterium]
MAFSMREACERVRSGERQNAELMLLGGVTRLVGVVHDSGSGDVVLVGQVTAADRKLALEDLVVALRAVLVHDEWPMVSIDKTPETAATGRQIVRFGGGIENSSFGRDLTEADITLKKMALGHLPVEELGASSYFANLSRYIQTEGPSADRVSCRFWFYPADAERALSGRQGVFVIKELRVGARAEILSAVVGGRPVTDLSRISSHPAEEFASGLTRSYEALARSRPELARVKGLYYALAAARGIESLDVRPAMAYWLTDFPVRPVTTLTHYPLLKRESGPQSEGGGFTLSGGVQLKALVVRLSEGDVTALRDIVLNARPGPRALTWRVPLGAWAVPGAADTEPDDGSMAGVVAEDVAALKVKWGCLMEAGFPRGDASPGSTATGSPSLPGLQRGTTMPRFGVEPTLPQYTPSTRPHNLGPPINQGTPQATTTPAVPDVGGVLLRAEPDARLSPIQGATWDGKGNQFGLVLSSGAAELPVQFADDWRTILLSIYGGEDPGLSLDPGPTRNIMLVRTIGKVQGTRLALVMLEADRLLKCYSLGRDNRTGEPMAPKIAG